MVFSSIFFLYAFLPITILLYFAVGRRFQNAILLSASLLFYAWGEMGYVLLMLLSIAMNWLIGLGIDAKKRQGRTAKSVLTIGVILNLLPLAFFKYGNFFVDNLNLMLVHLHFDTIELNALHLPIGISFFTFQAISYIVDVYRDEATVQKRPVNLALYIALFPQLIAGPIVRYRDIDKAITERQTRLEDISSGILRFIAGLGKKVLIANTMGAVADQIFSLPMENVSTSLAWLGILAYSLQIYFDFSGYSDMAIGLGRIFGFHFLENFNYPYISRSIQEFWRRWHISLSSWFRDYVYFPLGGNRAGTGRTYFNLLLVFFLCGLWHGASWSFAIWGFYHGSFLVIEKIGLAAVLKKLPALLRHMYVWLVVMIGWVFFRSETLPQALAYIQKMFSFETVPYLNAELFSALNNQFYLALVLGLLLSTPLLKNLIIKGDQLFNDTGGIKPMLFTAGKNMIVIVWMVLILLASTAQLLSSGYNPFLYFRF
ncbi:MAG: MBOAT family protein [Arenicellales bacterium]